MIKVELKKYCKGCTHFEPMKIGQEDFAIEQCLIACEYYEICADLFDRVFPSASTKD